MFVNCEKISIFSHFQTRLASGPFPLFQMLYKANRHLHHVLQYKCEILQTETAKPTREIIRAKSNSNSNSTRVLCVGGWKKKKEERKQLVEKIMMFILKNSHIQGLRWFEPSRNSLAFRNGLETRNQCSKVLWNVACNAQCSLAMIKAKCFCFIRLVFKLRFSVIPSNWILDTECSLLMPYDRCTYTQCYLW